MPRLVAAAAAAAALLLAPAAQAFVTTITSPVAEVTVKPGASRGGLSAVSKQPK